MNPALSAPLVSAPKLNGIYIAQGLSAAETVRRNLTLILTCDGKAAMTTEYVGKGTITERGVWKAEDSKAEIVWTELDGEAINLRMIFELRGNEMVLVGPDPYAFGAGGLKLTRAQSMERPGYLV